MCKNTTIGSNVLEIGMGPGKDLDILSQHYKVTGSDNSAIFLDLYRKGYSKADLVQLDAVTLKTERRFDGIYTNKVLHHLRKDELGQSLARQNALLGPGGIGLHSFWLGTSEEKYSGPRFVYYTEIELVEMVKPHFEILEKQIYREFEENGSIALVLKRR